MKCFVSRRKSAVTFQTDIHGSLSTMSDEASKVSTDDAVPCRALAAVKLHVRQHVLQNGSRHQLASFLMNWAISWVTG
jgi:hypothetical protein